MILFDTDTVTPYSFGNANVRRKIDESPDQQLAIAIITRNEVLRGRADSLLEAADEAELQKAVERFRQTKTVLSAFLVVDFDDEAIKRFGRLRKQKNLKKMGRADMLIACIALAQDALLVTGNTKDFKEVKGLRIENWVD